MTSNTDLKTSIQQNWNKIAPEYLSFITSLPSPNLYWCDQLLSALLSPNKARLLDIGCGNGLPVTKHLAERVAHVTANDMSLVQLDLAKEKLATCTNVEYMAGDMTALDFSQETFDAVVAMYCLQHLPTEEQGPMLKQIYVWLKPGGILVCNFDEQEDSGSMMQDWLGAHMFKSGLGVEGSKQIVAEAGFSIIEAEVIRDVDGKKTVPFLWVLARKGKQP